MARKINNARRHHEMKNSVLEGEKVYHSFRGRNCHASWHARLFHSVTSFVVLIRQLSIVNKSNEPTCQLSKLQSAISQPWHQFIHATAKFSCHFSRPFCCFGCLSPAEKLLCIHSVFTSIYRRLKPPRVCTLSSDSKNRKKNWKSYRDSQGRNGNSYRRIQARERA